MTNMLPVDQQLTILMRGVDFGDRQTYENMKSELRQRLTESVETGRPLRIYCGYDPTSPDLHLGHTVTMRKLRQFQELGHEVTFLIGNFTGLIGDPSDKDSARPQQTDAEVMEKARTYTDQAFRVLDKERTQVRYNAEWLSELSFKDVIHLASNFTVQQFLARDKFSQRHEKGEAIWLHEFFYALMQGYDAVAMRTDVQLGGTDQLFNLMAGRKLMESFGLRPQIAITLPILVGTDGELRMSKSTGNYIGIAESAEEMYGKLMSIPDSAMRNYAELASSWHPDFIQERFKALADGRVHPRDLKMELAREITGLFHSPAEVEAAEQHFVRTIQQGEAPEDMPELQVNADETIVDLLERAGFSSSRSQAKRDVAGEGVRLDGEVVADPQMQPQPGAEGMVLQKGKRRFVRLMPSGQR
ncbi:MAG: tyrosine--tRNA ligase [Caldilineales bacterium]|nr:tyrosine--tRNA ligase [Caldilineales bacterium]